MNAIKQWMSTYLRTLSCPQLFRVILHMQRTQPLAGMERYLAQPSSMNIDQSNEKNIQNLYV